jgi:hypothetical protein
LGIGKRNNSSPYKMLYRATVLKGFFGLLGWSDQGDGCGIQHTWERNKMHTKFWWENLKEREQLEDQVTDGRWATP